MNSKQKKALYESIMKQVSKTVKKTLNEMSPEVYRNAADRREAQINALPTYLKNKLGVNRNAPRDLRAHADKIEADIIKQQQEAEILHKKLLRKERIKILPYLKQDNAKYAIKEFLCYYQESEGYSIDITDDIKDIKKGLLNIINNIDQFDIQAFINNCYDTCYGNFWEDLLNKEKQENDKLLIEAIIKELPNFLNTFTDIDIFECVFVNIWENCGIVYNGEEDFDMLTDVYIFYNGNKGYVYTITNEYYSPSVEEYTKKSFNRKYELTGDFRGEWREVCDYAENDDEIVAVSDEESGYNYRLLSNSKRKLEKIGQELWDNHTAGCYEVSLI